MATTLESLQAEALRLPAADRARLLACLMDSLDADDEIDGAWSALADRRQAELDSGEVTAVPLAEAMKRLQAQFPE